jgi:hypothetical protein
MALDKDSRKERKVKAYLRARKTLQQRFERIDYEFDVVDVVIDALKAGKPVLGLPANMDFEMVLEDAHLHPSDTEDPQ